MTIEKELEALEKARIEAKEKVPPKTMKELKYRMIEMAKLEKESNSGLIKEKKIKDAIAKELTLKKNEKKSKEEIEDLVLSRYESVEYEGSLERDAAIKIIDELVHYIKIDDIDNPISLFDLDNGIYTTSVGFWYKIISWILPLSSEREKNTIMHILSTRANVKERYKKSDRIIVGNGIYNFTTKRLEPYNPKYVFTSKIATKYKKIKTEPCYDGWTFSNMLQEWTQGDEELEYSFWQIIRASIQLKVRKRFVLLRDNGQGRTGKGTFQSLIQGLIGKSNVLFLTMKEMEQGHLLEGLENAQAVIGDDNDKSAFLDEPRVLKSLATGDPLKINPKNKTPINFQGSPLIIQSMNGHLRTSDMSDAFKNRILFIPFTKSYIGIENTAIKEDYIHREDFLSWVLYQALQLEDFTLFNIPKVSDEVMQEFILENDIVADFFKSVFIHFKSGRVPADLGYQVFREWSGAVGKPSQLSQRAFTNRLLIFVEGSKDWKHSGQTALAPLHYLIDEKDHPYCDIIGNIFFGTDIKKRKSTYLNEANSKQIDKKILDREIDKQEQVIESIEKGRSNIKAIDIEESKKKLQELIKERENLGS